MDPKQRRDPVDRMVDAYEAMLERVDGMLESAGKSTLPALQKSLEAAREKAVELDELTREEAERIAGYLERDMQDAAHFLADTGEEFRDWLHFDIKLIEERMLGMCANVADRTRLELDRLARQASAAASRYHSGEITGPGTLVCEGCGETISFHQAGQIPVCPRCRGRRFTRRL
ncbi:MAG: zinc ribbon-containing protein [Candidatus Sedimenticola endophacoides]|uniref:Zinc ribbon-containing protein n=1 Tax=Candidatus Sedimenticola endophacoides TaxID=2548426 RepID=A0A6N4DN12_9GAMM|nr:MAG: hypothetical protein B0D94_01915 [Candidatus Sedimenticola endophacoides]OQX37028.1 MAG: hypothetical protein B0D96_02910 [Candidatus Sedimenticola endophacoides]OQX42222.1 MAG: hypothetical protein B0D89_01710 [Candidatus Sedimenticola endophacoides]PUD98314.1 MAG: hypothetical protein C3L26_12920 [Candidatus Sedimenticola endophacoides]PUD99790.1 MAG: hypothetical protein C3L24_10315 [Candidatus Sedimenticola endophacoides]